MKKIFLIPILMLFMSIVTFSQPKEQSQSDLEVENQIKQLEKERFRAMIQVDTASLDSILAEDLTYTHTNGWVQSKKDLMSSLESKELNYKSAITNDVVVRTYGICAVVTGSALMKVASHEQEYNLQIRFIDVYVKKDGNWQMAAWQSTRIPEH